MSIEVPSEQSRNKGNKNICRKMITSASRSFYVKSKLTCWDFDRIQLHGRYKSASTYLFPGFILQDNVSIETDRGKLGKLFPSQKGMLTAGAAAYNLLFCCKVNIYNYLFINR